MSLLLANLPRAGLLLAAAAALLGLFEERSRRPQTAAVAVEDASVARLCAAENYPDLYFWERLRTMGVRMALLRTEGLGQFLESGAALRFSEDEIERLQAAGAADKNAPLTAGSVWTADAALAGRFERAAEASGRPVEKTRYKGRFVFSVPPAAVLGAGYDPARAARLRELDLTPAYAIESAADFRLAAQDPHPAVYWIEGDPASWTEEDIESVNAELRGSDSWIVGSARAVSRFKTPRARLARTLAPGAGSAAAAASARGDRFLLFALDGEGGVEANLDAFRERFGVFRRAGLGVGPLPGPVSLRSLSKAENWARRLLLAAVFLVAPWIIFRVSKRSKTPASRIALILFGSLFAGLVGRLGAPILDYWTAPWYPVGGTWLARHWLSALIGWPAVALGAPLGFVASIGVIWVVSNVCLPVETAVLESFFAAAAGLALGGVIFWVKKAFSGR